MPVKKWIESADNAIEGILHAAKTQRHLRYHFYASGIVLVLSYALGVSRTEFLIIALAVIAVLAAEMMNTAVEAVVDIVSPGHSRRARAAKDIAAGGVLITAFGAVMLGYIVLFPYIKRAFSDGLRIAKHTSEDIAVVSFTLVLIMVILLKAYYGKGHPLKGGLPSGHAAVAFSAWVSVAYTTESFVASALCFVLALIIAITRVTSKVHRVHEVVLGALIGALITFAMFRIFQ